MIEGYKRSDDMRWRLVQVLKAAMYNHPELRLGQIIVNAIGTNADLFNLWDEKLIAALEEFLNDSKR